MVGHFGCVLICQKIDQRKPILMCKEKDLIQARVNQLGAAAPLLQSIRDENIKTADTLQSMKCFSGMVLSELSTHPPHLWSGLVDQQRWFHKLRFE